MVDDIEMAKTWYIFWVFPAAFFLLNRLIRPRYYETLYTNRVMKFYPILILALLTFLLLFYFMFYLMASEMNQNTRLLKMSFCSSRVPSTAISSAPSMRRGSPAMTSVSISRCSRDTQRTKILTRSQTISLLSGNI